jgi:hypothetical protein
MLSLHTGLRIHVQNQVDFSAGGCARSMNGDHFILAASLKVVRSDNPTNAESEALDAFFSLVDSYDGYFTFANGS